MVQSLLSLASASSAGRRAHQEDSYLCRIGGGSALIAVADGMGGHAAGEVASRIVVETLDQFFSGEGPTQDPGGLLQAAAAAANREVLRAGDESPEKAGLGSTLVAALVRDNGAYIGHAGDSRAWLVTPDDVIQLTWDHSALQDALDRGVLASEDAAGSPYRHAILRSIGDREFPGLDATAGAVGLQKGSVVLLTSDGAHSVLTPADYLEHIAGTPVLGKALDNLMRLAYVRGSDDNITLVGCEYGRFPRSRIRAQTPPEIEPGRKPLRRPQTHFLRLQVLLLVLSALVTVGLSVRLVRELLSPARSLRAPSAVSTQPARGEPRASPAGPTQPAESPLPPAAPPPQRANALPVPTGAAGLHAKAGAR